MSKSTTIIDVWLPLPVNKTYSYLIPDALKITLSERGQMLCSGSFVEVPFGKKRLLAIVAQENKELKDPIFIEKKLKNVIDIYDVTPLNKNYLDFLHFFSHYTMTPFGLVLRMALRGAGGVLDKKLQKVFSLKDKLYQAKNAAGQRALVVLKEGQVWTQKTLIEAANISVSTLKTLEKHGAIESHFQNEAPLSWFSLSMGLKISLEREQKEAAFFLEEMVTRDGHQVALLDGVTGSGKTEVYFHAVYKALKLGKQVLILLPEIALTQQFLERFYHQFGAYPVEWHSNLTKNQREKIWRQVKNGGLQMIVGARSALFLPFQNLGLIVIDEEHDQSFKQAENVFYNARDMAVARAHYENIPIILSSATPSLESYVNALEGKYSLVRLTERYQMASLPEIKLTDRPKNPPYLSKDLQKILVETLEKGEQSLLFLNRRGYAPFTICRNCGYKMRCAQCSTYLVLHQASACYKCHQCDFVEPLSEVCPQCHEDADFVHNFAGVERIFEEISILYPKARILVLSSDLLGSLSKIRRAFAAIENHEVDIIIGTQMITKGHHFPDLTFVGVLDADFSLKNGDFRASERLFQLLSQVTGRAGRTGKKSLGYIQTDHPKQPLLEAICCYDREKFYHLELAVRKKYHYPPFGRMAGLIISGKDAKACEEYGRLLRRKAPLVKNIEIFGPTEAEIFMIRGLYRYRLLIKAEKNVNLQNYIHNLCEQAGRPKQGLNLQIDIDPQSFL